MVNEDENVSNWILDDTGVLFQKVAKKIYSSSMEFVDGGNLIWLDEVSLAKTLVCFEVVVWLFTY